MAEITAAIKGLACPKCGGMVPIPEGQAVVVCPYCELPALVRGDRGIRRYQVPRRIERDTAIAALREFLGNWAIARDVASRSQLSEVFIAHLPFWALWGRAIGWAFGQKRVGSGKNSHYEAREVRIAEEMTWTGAACDVGEFGVQSVPLADQRLDPFDGEALHRSGLVFEPVGSMSDARSGAATNFEDRVRSRARLDRLGQLFVRFVKSRFGLVYYPLWVIRYLYRGRAFQVVVDAFSGKVLYGKAPGNTWYRAAMLVAGMALGAFVLVDVPVFLLGSIDNDSGDAMIAILLVALAAGAAIMGFAYRTFRYGEQYEFGAPPAGKLGSQVVQDLTGSTEAGRVFSVIMEVVESTIREAK